MSTETDLHFVTSMGMEVAHNSPSNKDLRRAKSIAQDLELRSNLSCLRDEQEVIIWSTRSRSSGKSYRWI